MKYWLAVPIALMNYYCVVIFSTFTCGLSFSEALSVTTVKNFRPVLTTTTTTTTTKVDNNDGESKNDPTTTPSSLSTSPHVLPIFRSATLDNLSFEDADQLLSGSAFVEPGFDSDGSDIIRPLAAVIDLRNHDEIQKGQRNRTDGSIYFYQQL